MVLRVNEELEKEKEVKGIRYSEGEKERMKERMNEDRERVMEIEREGIEWKR